MTGTAIPSAVRRLLLTCARMSLLIAALPPTVTSTWLLCDRRLASSDELRLRSLLVLPKMSAYLPSFDLRPGLRVCQYDTPFDTPGTAARRLAASAPAARAGAPSTVPASAWTSRTTPTEPPKRWSVSVCAVADPAPGSRKPPVFSLPNAPNPSTPNPTTASIATISTRRARRTTKLPIDPLVLRPGPSPRRARSWLLVVVMSAPFVDVGPLVRRGRYGYRASTVVVRCPVAMSYTWPETLTFGESNGAVSSRSTSALTVMCGSAT